MTGSTDLTVCVIARDDQKAITDCLRQAKGVAREMIVADIGSADGCAKTAELAGARVYPVQWNSDYSEVKNFCMDRARGGWVLFLQPNEWISEEHWEKIPLLLNNPNAEAYLTLIDYHSEGFAISSPVQSIRLVRNRKENRFRCRSFESIPDEVLTGAVSSDVEIKQTEDATLSWELITRRALLEEEAAANPPDSYLQYMLGLMRLNESRLEESVVCLQAARSAANPGCLYAPHLYKCLAWACMCLEKHDDALQALDEGIDRCPFYTDLLVLRAEIHKRFERYGQALEDLERCLSTRQFVNLSVPRAEIGDAYVFESLGEIAEATGRACDALNHYALAFQLDPADTELQGKIDELAARCGSMAHAPADRNLAGFLRALGGWDGIGEPPADAQAHEFIGDRYRAAGRMTEAHAAYTRALRTEPQDYRVQLKMQDIAGKISAGANGMPD